MNTRIKHLVLRLGTLVLLSLLLLVQWAGAAPQAMTALVDASAQPLISYQGTLTDPDGNPVNGTVTMKFGLHDASTGGTQKWGPETQSVQVTNGLFNVLLGSATAIDPTQLTGDLWLDITVNNEQLTPRERVAGATYALAGMADPFTVSTRLYVTAEAGTYNAAHLVLVNTTSGNKWQVTERAAENDDLQFWFWNAAQSIWNRSMSLSGAGNAMVSNRLAVGPGTLAEPLQVKADWSFLGLDTLAADQDAGLRLYENSIAKWHIFNDASEGSRLTIGSEGQVIATVPQSGEMSLYRPLSVTSALGVGAPTDWEAQVMIQSSAVPLKLKESDSSGAGSLWRMPLDGTNLRFDSSDNGADFSAFHTALTMYPNGTVGCGAITENNLQTEKERAAGGSDRFEEGDVLCWSPKAQRLEKCTMPDDSLVQAVADTGGRPIVMGAEVVKVIGPVRAGDYLVASSVPGYATVSTNPRFGIVIAQALEDFEGERGLIKAMIRKF